MINLHTDILDKLEANELMLCLQIARHVGKNRTAWPGVERLMRLTGWSKNRVIRARRSLEKKGVIKVVMRKDSAGRDKSHVYRLTTDLIGIYVGANVLPDGGSETFKDGGSKMNKRGFHFDENGGNKMEPEVLSNRSIIQERETPSLSAAEKFIEAHTPPRNGFDPFNKTTMPKY